jgi:hypothetical protein
MSGGISNTSPLDRFLFLSFKVLISLFNVEDIHRIIWACNTYNLEGKGIGEKT